MNSPMAEDSKIVLAELRRLHAEVEELRGALDEAMWHVKYKELKAVNESDTALLRQCLEALESGDWYIDQLEMIVYSADDTGINGERAKVQAAITALRERLGEKT